MSQVNLGVAGRAWRGAVLGVVVMVAFLLGAWVGSVAAQALRPPHSSEGWAYLNVVFAGAVMGGAVVSLIIARLTTAALKLGRPWTTAVVAGLLNVSIILAALVRGSRLPPFPVTAAIVVASFALSGALAAVLVARQPSRDGSADLRMPLQSNVDG